MFVSQVRCADAGANAGLFDTFDWDGPDGLLNTLNFNPLKWDTANKWKEEQRKKRTCEPLRLFGGYLPEVPVDHVNTSEAERRDALTTLRADDSEGSDGGGSDGGGAMVGGVGGSMVGGSMVGGAMVGGAMEGGAMVGGGRWWGEWWCEVGGTSSRGGSDNQGDNQALAGAGATYKRRGGLCGYSC